MIYKNKFQKGNYSKSLLKATINHYVQKYDSEQKPDYNVLCNTKIVLCITYGL